MKRRIATAILVATVSAAVLAGEEEDYNRRAAERDMALFQELDRDHDGYLMPEEVRGNVSMQSRFNEIDINRDGRISMEEMQRYILATYHLTAEDLVKRKTEE